MKKKSKRYYGMTVSQIGILAGVAGVVLLCIGGAFFFILMQPPLQSQGPVPVATVTYSTQTPAPTSTVIEPTATLAPLIATSVPPGGWVEFQGAQAALWLPGNFVGGDIARDKDKIILSVSKQGRYFKNVLSAMRVADPAINLWMVDKTVGKAAIAITMVMVRHYVLTEDETLEQYIATANNSDYNGTPLAMFMTINNTQKLKLLGLETVRQTYQEQGMGPDTSGIVYYIKDGADFWIVDYTMDPNQYLAMLPIIEDSIHTFYLNK